MTHFNTHRPSLRHLSCAAVCVASMAAASSASAQNNAAPVGPYSSAAAAASAEQPPFDAGYPAPLGESGDRGTELNSPVALGFGLSLLVPNLTLLGVGIDVATTPCDILCFQDVGVGLSVVAGTLAATGLALTIVGAVPVEDRSSADRSAPQSTVRLHVVGNNLLLQGSF